MPRGIVKWYNPNRGFGFIAPEDGTEVIFADSEKVIDELKELKEGIEVDYQILTFSKSQQAIQIKRINKD